MIHVITTGLHEDYVILGVIECNDFEVLRPILLGMYLESIGLNIPEDIVCKILAFIVRPDSVDQDCINKYLRSYKLHSEFAKFIVEKVGTKHKEEDFTL
jgi:hypothetical protein